MRKVIRLLVESFFDDEIFNQKEDINQDIQDIGEQYYNYQVDDIYYKDKNPYAVCCGESKYFIDNRPRFCLLNKVSKYTMQWMSKDKYILINKQQVPLHRKSIITQPGVYHLEETGYENTQNVLNNFNISDFPAFRYCIDIHNNAYLPAIDEFQILFFNLDKLQDFNILTKLNNVYWSSSENNKLYAYFCRLNKNKENFYYEYIKTPKRKVIS